MKILQGYLVKECVPPFFLSYLVATFMFLVRGMRDRVERFSDVGVQLSDIVKVTALSLPVVSVYVVPIAVLLGVVFGVARLSKDTEMVAVRASGISLKQLAWPMLILGALLSVACFGVTEGFAPFAELKAKQLLVMAALRHPAALAKPGQWVEFGGMRMRVGWGDPRSGEMKDVVIVLFEEDKPTIFLNAARGAFEKGTNEIPTLKLLDGEIHEQGRRAVTYFAWTAIPLDFSNRSAFKGFSEKAGGREAHEMHLQQLAQAVSDQSLSEKKRDELRNELGQRCSLPFACFIFVLIGLPLAGRNVRAGRSYGLALAFMTVIVYYVLLLIGQTLVERGLVNPILGNSLANIVFGSTGIMLFAKTQ